MWLHDTQRVSIACLNVLYQNDQFHHLSLALLYSSLRCPQNGGVARGIGVYTDEEWRAFAEENVRHRFKDNPKKCQMPLNEYFIGAEDVRQCTRLNRKCGYYLSLIPGVNDTARRVSESWRQSLEKQAVMHNRSF